MPLLREGTMKKPKNLFWALKDKNGSLCDVLYFTKLEAVVKCWHEFGEKVVRVRVVEVKGSK